MTMRKMPREPTHFYIQETLSTACGRRVWDYPHYFGGKRYWHGRPHAIAPLSMRQTERLVKCPECLARVRADRRLLSQDAVSRRAVDFLAPECRHLLSEYRKDIGA
jgi:hypothetical protein